MPSSGKKNKKSPGGGGGGAKRARYGASVGDPYYRNPTMSSCHPDLPACLDPHPYMRPLLPGAMTD
jgi:hypothetical protein